MVKMDGDRAYLQLGFWEIDRDNPAAPPAYQKSRKWMLSPHMTKSEVVQTAFKAVMTAEEHETREKFSYRGQPVFGPHFDLDQLVRICGLGHQDARVPIAVPA